MPRLSLRFLHPYRGARLGPRTLLPAEWQGPEKSAFTAIRRSEFSGSLQDRLPVISS